MRPLVKPLVAVVAFSLATSTAFAAMGAGKTASKAASCGPVVNKELDKFLNPNSPTRTLDTCWGERFAFGGTARFTAENVEDAFLSDENADGTATAPNGETFMNVRELTLLTDVMLSKMADLHIALQAESDLSNNMLVSGNEIDASISITEAYVVLSDFAKAPVYLKLGRAYSPFGFYEKTLPSVYSLNQSLVIGDNTQATLGFASKAGYDLSVTLFEDESNSDWDQVILRFGTKQSFKGVEFGFAASYVDNYSSLNGSNASLAVTNATSDTSAYDVALGAKMRDFSLGLEYFAVDKDILTSSGSNTTTKPSVFSIAGKYDFLASGKKGDFHVGYEKSYDASEVSTTAFADWEVLPETHTTLGVTFEIEKGLDLSIDMHNFSSYTSGTDDQVQYVAELEFSF